MRLATHPATVARDGEGGLVTVTLEGGDQLIADELLVAAGRTPNTSGIGLERFGVEPGEPIAVDQSLRVRGQGEWLTRSATATGSRC